MRRRLEQRLASFDDGTVLQIDQRDRTPKSRDAFEDHPTR